MSQLVYGKNSQVRFSSEAEKNEAIEYIVDNLGGNVELRHEDNQNQGAWECEERIHFKSEAGVPECLKDNMTAGRGSLYGRINCAEFVEEIRRHIP